MINIEQTFALSLMVNAINNQIGSPDALSAGLKEQVETAFADANFTKTLGAWSLVWGPYVYQVKNSSVADNTMMLVYNAAENTYVLAIAATNSQSSFDWKVEDAGVNSLVKLPHGDGKARISWGTNIGIAFLSGLGGANNTIVDILSSDLPNKSSANFVITGHSLGGALSPALGVSLFNPVNGPLASAGWNTASLYMLPTAGASVGDQNYYALATRTFTSTAAPGFNKLHYNTLDVVPQAWDPKSFNKTRLMDIYKPKLTPSADVARMINTALALPPAPNPYVRLPAIEFAGTFQTQNAALPDRSDTSEFLDQMLYQHVYAYVVALAPSLITLRDVNGQLIFTLPNPFTQTQSRTEVTIIANQMNAL